MDNGSSSSSRQITIAYNDLKSIYLHNVQIYLEIPDYSINQIEMEELALSRLGLLKIFEKSIIEGHKHYSTEWTNYILHHVRLKYRGTFYILCEKDTELDNPSEKELQARRIDYISHIILRIAYCGLSQSHDWFIEREAEWLYLRYQNQSTISRQVFLKLNHLNYVPISSEEKTMLLKRSCTFKENEDYYKIHFKQCMSLIKERKILLYKGNGYVSDSELVFCITDRFKSYLRTFFTRTCQNMTLMNKDYIALVDLIKAKLENEDFRISKGIITDYISQNNIKSITYLKLNRNDKKSFPLCMKNIYDILKENHHLKYGSRHQLGVFIKSIGLSMEDSLKFWKNEFCNIMTHENFEKKYTYHIKHMYGKVGRQKEYLPQSCRHIISKNVGPYDTHGCPFILWESQHLYKKLTEYGLPQSGINSIINKVENQQYQQACAKYFEVVHGQMKRLFTVFPHEYFNDSQDILNENNLSEISSDEDED